MPSKDMVSGSGPLRNGGSDAALANLPPELLAHIVKHIKTATSLTRLSQTCRRIHAFMQENGFRVFVQTRFPYVEPPIGHGPSFWKDSIHSLTTLSRNWDRKAFIAWSIHPQAQENQEHRRQRTYFRSGQTMGFVPVIDSYDAWYGGDWSSRKEVVAWGAGAGLILRIKTRGRKAEDAWEATTDRNLRDFNVHHHRVSWIKYHKAGAVEGRDDVTSVNVLPQSSLDDPEHVVIGRASGCLSLNSFAPDATQDNAKRLVSYETAGRAVRSATASGSRGHLAACLSDSSIALYPLDVERGHVSPVAEDSAISAGVRGRTWSCQFLSHDRLAVGYGPSEEPIRVYRLGRGELRPEDARTLSMADAIADTRLDNAEMHSSCATSVYSLAPVSTFASASGTPGDIFLSGAYDGLTRLHDMRASNSAIAVFRDPVDTFSPIYSLVPIGTERFVAGGARHSIIKVFDLRMPGDRLYHAVDVDACSREGLSLPGQKESTRHCKFHYETKYKRRGWNVFLKMPSKRDQRDSPVYALSRPSHCSTSIFAGIESNIVQLDIVSIMDRHPDPVFNQGPVSNGDRNDVRRRWDPHGESIPMPMYEHDTGPVKLIKQRANVEYSERSARQGWDERWLFDTGR